MSSDCLLLSLPQGLERKRVEGWAWQPFDLGEGEEQGYHRRPSAKGDWRAAESLTVRGGPGLTSAWFRTTFEHPGWPERSLLRFDGAFTAANVWLNGKMLGNHYGYPGRFGFDISSHLKPTNFLSVCVQATDEGGHMPAALSDMEDDGGDRWWPVGMVGRVWLEHVGSVVIEALDTRWRLMPDVAEATIQTRVTNLDGREMPVTVAWQLFAPGNETPQVRWRRSTTLGGGRTVVLDTRVAVDRPMLWWPWTLGDQHLYRLSAQLNSPDRRSSSAAREVGIRDVTLEPSGPGLGWVVNGRRHFPRGAVLPPLPPGSDGDPIGAWRLAGLDLALSRGQFPSERTAASADAAGVLLVIDPPRQSPTSGEDHYEGHQDEAIGLLASHASAAVLLQRGASAVPEAMRASSSADEPYTLTGTGREDLEPVRRAKYGPQSALVLTGLPDLDSSGGALAATVALLDWTRYGDGAVRLRFYVVNDDASVSGDAVVRWRVHADVQSSWMPFSRGRSGQVGVRLPATDQPPVMLEGEASLPAGAGAIIEVELEQDGVVLSQLEYEVEAS